MRQPKVLGCWVLAPDRPGIGLSDHDPDRSLLTWPDDVADMADQLGFLEFAVCGFSFGGPYVRACAYKLAGRVHGITRCGGFEPP
jgi:pimeloyl-ACP methyl ester carboxylesterase